MNLKLAVLIWHRTDLAAATALARRLGDELTDGETLVSRDISGGADLDPAVDREGTVWHAGDAGEETDVVLVLAADVTPQPGLLSALRRAPKEWDAWTGVLLDPHGGAVAAAGIELSFTARALPGRPGLAVERLPETPFLSAALPSELFAVRRQAVAELSALGRAATPAGAALDLSLRLRASGGRAGVMPGARVRLAERRPQEAGMGDRIPSVVRAYPTPILAVTGPALALSGPLAIARGALAGSRRDTLSDYRAGLSAGRAAARERTTLEALRSLDSATFSDGLQATSPDASAATKVLAGAWWGAAASALRVQRARHRRLAARGH